MIGCRYDECSILTALNIYWRLAESKNIQNLFLFVKVVERHRVYLVLTCSTCICYRVRSWGYIELATTWSSSATVVEQNKKKLKLSLEPYLPTHTLTQSLTYSSISNSKCRTEWKENHTILIVNVRKNYRWLVATVVVMEHQQLLKYWRILHCSCLCMFCWCH